MNLCGNAADAMNETGTLTLRTRNIENARIEVQIQDTGVGMSKEIQEKAFEPFFTTKPEGKGTGLGLSIAYGTVKAHQGEMEIQSEPGLGTVVSIRLPAHGAVNEATEPEAAPEQASSPRSLSVLLVDDDELVQLSTQEVLKTLGHHATSATSGEEALVKLEAGLEPDVVILDMNMPGLGGRGTLPRLRGLRPAVPVLLATGRVDQIALDLERDHPFVTLLPKPFNLEELEKRLKDIPTHGS
jgi:CheY-like chemotaxis protein